MCQAALQYARRGWPVFPCREKTETLVNSAKKEITFNAKAPYTGKGLKDATTDEDRIKAWWRQHPDALIGLPMGVNGCFVLDFDPRCDDDSGEVWTLERLKAELEGQIGVALPRSLTAITQSDGVHVYFRQPEGAPITNRGNLPQHVDVRGQGGYVIAPPSVMTETGARYRWMRDRGDWRDDADVAEAPPELIEVLRSRKAKRPAEPSPAAPPADRPSVAAGAVDDDVRKYALTALDGECQAIRQARSGQRNAQLNESAFKVATLVAAGALDQAIARSSVESAARANPGNDDDRQLIATIDSGWTAGLDSPRDLSEIAAASRSRRERGSRSFRASAPARAAPPPSARADEMTRSFRDGREDDQSGVSEGDLARFVASNAAWMKRRLEHVERSKDAIVRLAFSIGRRVAAGLVGEGAAKDALWGVYEGVADVQHADIDRAIDDGRARGFDIEAMRLTLTCSGYPTTDFGIAERFRDRHGPNFRFTTGKGWLGWDGRRWKVLDQDEKTPPAEVIAAVFDTVRAIQDEARFIEDTGIKLTEDELPEGELYKAQLNPYGLDRYIPKGKQMIKHSAIVRAWGRQSETTGKPAAVAMLARRWLTVPIEKFDHDPYAVNVLNGTLRFRREEMPDGTIKSAVELSEHRREDMLTKITRAAYDPDARSPLYDGMFEWAQPDGAMRRYLHQVGGYALTGDAGEQKLWFWYGRGRNGKGVTIESWCHIAGDYSDTVPIASLLDQGVKKRGDQASPDLAKLAGVRMLRSSEPGRNEKLDTGLVKLVTGGEPFDVRMLHRGFFQLMPQFKLIISGNTKFEIPDTDDGIWGRLKLIPWLRNIDRPEPGVENWPTKDLHLADKIKAQEASGLLNHLVRGLLDYLANGLLEPKSVTDATSAYRDASDPLARFLRACVVEDDDSRIQSSKLHEVFVAWCKAAGEREWSNKGFSNAMVEKGYKKKQSDGMQWLGLRLVKEVDDFIDADGKVRAQSEEGDLSGARPPPARTTFGVDDDDVPL